MGNVIVIQLVYRGIHKCV